jgi:aminoglycoside 3-N-acetyltransferase I
VFLERLSIDDNKIEKLYQTNYMNVEFRKLQKNEAEKVSKLLELYIRVFGVEADISEPPTPEYLKNLLQKDNVLFFAAEVDNITIGGLTAYTLPSIYREDNEVYIYDLAVDQKYQRQGIGTSLMKYFLAEMKKQGVKYVYVQADKVDDHAIAFYKKLGGVEEDVFHYDFRLF